MSDFKLNIVYIGHGMRSKISDLKEINIAIEELNFVLEFFKTGDFLFELHNVAIAQGFSSVAEKAGLARESLYKTLDPNAKPQWETIVKILNAMGMRIQLIPAKRSLFKPSFVPRKNSLANKSPELSLEWHSVKNGKIAPIDITLFSHKKFWWQCPANSKHEWQSSVFRRTNGEQCPFCKAKNLLRNIEE